MSEMLGMDSRLLMLCIDPDHTCLVMIPLQLRLRAGLRIVGGCSDPDTSMCMNFPLICPEQGVTLLQFEGLGNA